VEIRRAGEFAAYLGVIGWVSLEIWEFWDYNEFSGRSDLGFLEGFSWSWESWHDELVNMFTFGPRLVIESKNKARSPCGWSSVREFMKI
jgi:hypothetical protein